MQNVHYFILVFGWVGGGWVVFHHFQVLFHHFHVLFLLIFRINVRVLTMLAASIDGFLLFWQPATS